MKRLFLASVSRNVMDEFLKILDKDPKETRVAFIPTAADTYEEKEWWEEDRKKWIDAGFIFKEVDLKNKDQRALLTELKDCDIIYVAGGNTFYLLEKVRESGFDNVIKKLVSEGKIYAGESAGTILACPDIEFIKSWDDPSKAPKLWSFEALGLVDFYILPHYGEKKKEGYGKKADELRKEGHTVILLTDNQAVYVEGDDYRIVGGKNE